MKKCKYFKNENCSKSFVDMEFTELVEMLRGRTLVAIGKGEYVSEFYMSCELVLRWANHNRPAASDGTGAE